MKMPLRPRSRQGFALLLVLIVVSFTAAIALLFLLSAQQERTGTDSYAQGSRVRQLAATSVNLVMGQISTATKQGTSAAPVSWASQPGMIRTYDQTGSLKNAFKLYSWNNLVADSTFNPNDAANELPPKTWSTLPALYTDLNQPVNGVYPIVDPAAATQVEDFSIDSTNVAVTGSPANTAPMPVQWLYVLQDGSWVAPTAGAGSSVTVAGASVANPITGRIAFWTDDETSKVNINTASEGAYWDWPKAASRDEMQFAGNPPVKNEFNRVPGHPATTSLSAVFPEMRQGTSNRWTSLTTYAQQLQDIFSLTPRIDWGLGGSKGGTYPMSSYTAAYAPANSAWVDITTYSPMTPDADRLYATADDLWFKSNHANANNFASYNITPSMLSQRLFFLSANSNAPETTLFETPRVSLWPITYPYLSSFWSDFSANCTMATTKFTGRRTASKPTSFPAPDTTANPLTTLAAANPAASVYRYITPQEQLIGFCSTLNATATTPTGYYFQRQNPDSPTNDWSNIKRNRDLVTYLRNEMGKAPPGFGTSLATKWESWAAGNTDWTALNCLDFSRSMINQYTDSTTSTSGDLLYSFAGYSFHQGAVSGSGGSDYSEPNAATVVPLRSSFNGNTYISQGAYPTLKEAAVLFFATSRREPVPPMNGTAIDGNKIPFAGEWQNLITYTPGSPATGKSQTKSMQAMMFFSFSQMNPGNPEFLPVFWLKVKPLNGSFSVNGTTINLPSATHNSVQWNCYADGFFTQQFFGPLFYKQYNQPKIFSNAPPTTPSNPGTLVTSSPSYYTLISDPIILDPDQINFTFTGTNVQVEIYAPDSSNLDVDTTSDPTKLISTQQIDFSAWNKTLPIPLAPRWNACQKPLSLAGTVPSRTYTSVAVSGVAMPDPTMSVAEPTSVNPTPPTPPAGWQVEVVPQFFSFTTPAGSLMSDDGLSAQLPAYNLSTTGPITTSYGSGSPIGRIPYVYSGSVSSFGASAISLTYSPAIGNNGAISTDMRCRVAGLSQRTPSTVGKSIGFLAEGPSVDPFTVSYSMNDVRAFTLITPYDTVISMVSDPTSGTGKSAGDPRLMGKGLATAAGSTTFIPITTALAGALPNHVLGTNAANTYVTTQKVNLANCSVYPPRSTDQAQFHQLGWPGCSGMLTGTYSSMPLFTGYLTMPTFGGGTNYMGIRGGESSTAALGSQDAPSFAVGLEANVTMSLDPNGDWTSMPGLSPDGGYLSRPDQDYQVMTQESSSAYQFVPYFHQYATGMSKSLKADGTFTATTGAYFMPNRQVPSPIVLGTLPSDMKTGWQTLTFCPNPARTMNGAGDHPGLGVKTNLASPAAAKGSPYSSAPDHLLLDLFWMPVAEPYPISGQFATAGKVNLNYAMMPFPYIVRKTALDAVLKSVWLYAAPASIAANYKAFTLLSTNSPAVRTRYPVSVDETLKAFDAKFSTGDIFRSASQICDMFLYPNDPAKSPNNPLVAYDNANANITGWWSGQKLTSDNGREEPYNAIYSRVTTKSNAYTVHWRVQALQKAGTTAANASTWTEGTDRVTSELRGSSLIERYLDPNATDIPDYPTATNPLPLSHYYKWRVDSETYFQPAP